MVTFILRPWVPCTNWNKLFFLSRFWGVFGKVRAFKNFFSETMTLLLKTVSAFEKQYLDSTVEYSTFLIVGSSLQVDPIPHSYNPVTHLTSSPSSPPPSPTRDLMIYFTLIFQNSCSTPEISQFSC